MDELIFPIVLLIGLLVLVLPIVALATALAARRRAEELQGQVNRLEGQLKKLERGDAVDSSPLVRAKKAESSPEREVERESSGRAAASPRPELATPAETLAPPAEAVVPEEESPASAPSRPPQPPPLPTSSPAPIGAPSTPPSPPREPFNWEQFMGAKLFAWIGGLALFLGIGFFVKYAFDRDLIPPVLRVALGFASGLGLLVGGCLMNKKRYAITSHALCATGVLVLYATTFACRAVYHFEFFGLIPTFLLMAVITVGAFLLAIRLEAVVVAVLGLAGGFLTPVLLSTGEDNPLGLFGYIALLNAGLIAVALRRRWDFLLALGALGTVATQWGWYATFFTLPKSGIGLSIFLSFAVLFLAAAVLARWSGRLNEWLAWPAAALAASAFLFAALCIGDRELAALPALVLAAVLVPSACLAALTILCRGWPLFQAAGAGIGFLLLASWLAGTGGQPEQLPWALGACLAFALLHSAVPLVAVRFGMTGSEMRWLHLLPLCSLALVLFPVAMVEELSLFAWPGVFLITGVLVAAAVVARAPWLLAGALLATLLVLLVWVSRVSAGGDSLGELLAVIGCFAAGSSVVAFLLRERIGQGIGDEQAPWEKPFNELLPHLPATVAVLPFALLYIVISRFQLVDPSPVFGLALGLAGIMLGLAWVLPNRALPLVGVICVAGLQQVWQLHHLSSAVEAGSAFGPLAWHVGFYAIFALWPFVAWTRMRDSILPWVAGALSGPLHFLLVHRLVGMAYPNDFMGVVPALFALPALASLAVLVKRIPADAAERTTLLAWFGGVALFFLTLIVPIQFEREWITLGWALEGVALLWLFHRVPHPGLRLTGLALLAVAFVRLALNPAVLSYHPRGELPLLNWYLYVYGIGTACFFLAAWLLRGPRGRVFEVTVPPILCSLGTVLAFLLVNIEIADFFTVPGAQTLTFDFSGHFGRDMTYTIVWSLFALGLVIIGLVRRIPLARYAGIGLLAITLLKLFLHDLASLEALYRIGALMGTAVVAIFASFLYQKLLAQPAKAPEDEPAPKPG